MPRTLLFCAVLALGASGAGATGAEESLEQGIHACRAGRTDSAIVLLSRRADNPYLEAFRLYYRAECFLRDSMYGEAAAGVDTLFSLVDSGLIDKNHRLIDRARNLSVEALARNGSCAASRLVSVQNDYRDLSARAAFLASGACFAAGDSAAAIRLFTSAVSSKPAPEDSVLLKELIYRYRGLLSRVGNRACGSIARSAARLRLRREADMIVEHILAGDPEGHETLLCKLDVLSLTGEKERALQLCWRLFNSSAPVHVKATALLRAASLEYDMKRHDKAAEHYRMYGMYYPGSERAPFALDTAARIHVLRKEWKQALGIWRALRKRRDRDGIAIDAGVSEAVLRLRLGESAEARRILMNLLPQAGGADSGAVLYWIMRTAPSDSMRAVWCDSLIRAHPRSLYAAVAQRGEDSLFSDRGAADDGRRLKALVDSARRRIASYDTVRADSVFERHPAFEAYRVLLGFGLNEEAEMTAQTILQMRDLVHPHSAMNRLFRLYAASVVGGRDAFALTLLGRLGGWGASRTSLWELGYPVPYAGDILREAEQSGISPLVVLALMREESRFDPEAISAAGALGLMQLMPATASWIASQRDSSVLMPDDLFDPGKNISIGVRYLDYLLGRVGGSLVAALAAYNGGEGKMAAWNESFKPAEEPLAAIEMIGPRETRLYVKRVLESLSAYRAIAEDRGAQQ